MAANKEQLYQLMSLRHKHLPKWIQGHIPKHYKRCTASDEEMMELAVLGQSEVGAAFGDKLYFMQAVIAGAMLCGRYYRIILCTPSQYGKSWLLGRIAIIRAYRGNKEYVAGGRKNTTEIIMGHMLNALQYVPSEIEKALTETESQLKKLSKSLSKTKISFQNGGFVEGITLGDTFADTASNAAVGRGGDYIVDEAALISEDTLSELGRIDFAKLDGEKCLLTMISNPHKPGVFYDELTQDDPHEGTFILWIDALTAVEEGRFTEDSVMNGEFSNNRRTLRKYLLCELDVTGDSMFETPKVVEKPKGEICYRFLGVDAAYKGKDNLCVALVSVTTDGKVHCEEIEALDKSNWVDGVTNREIIKEITRIAVATQASLICVDQGWGVWLIQGLIEAGVPALGIGFQWKPTPARVRANEYAATNAQNMRAEMHLDLQNLIEDNYFDISPDAYAKIKDVLPFVLCGRMSSGKIQVRPKAEIKKSIGRSPDELDSLLLAIHAVIVFFGESLTFTA